MVNCSESTNYIYLHGFASSPQSAKAVYLRDRFSELGIDLSTLDLNQGDFSGLTLTRQLQQVESEFTSKNTPQILIGSSFGGLTAAWLSQRGFSVNKLVLLAPAFEFLTHWLPQIGEVKLNQWKTQGYLSVYHYSEKRDLPLSYQFIEDLFLYPDEQLNYSIPTLILHGINDEVIPIEASRKFAQQRPWAKLIELDSDHSLGNVFPQIWQQIQLFLN